MSTLHILKKFDSRQLFRLFVDGRFHRKYDGWKGYEAGEKGSIQALLNALSYMLDHFDLTSGLRSSYLLDLHRICMSGVQTSNPKSSPGDLRCLNAGMPFFPSTTTRENIREILEMRRGDGTAVFNTKGFDKPAEQLDTDQVYRAIQEKGRLNYRNWYPNLNQQQTDALQKRHGLLAYYAAKHHVQMQFAERVEEIVERFNAAIATAETAAARLRAIALLIRELELLHPFPDGNCRTFACILLNQLLLNYDFTPALLENPNLDGEQSLDEWIGVIEHGMAQTELLLANPEARVYGYAISDMAQEDCLTFLHMAHDVIHKIHHYEEAYLTPARLIAYTGGQWQGNTPEFLRFSGVGEYNTYRPGHLYFAMELAAWQEKGLDIRQELQKVIDKGVRALVIDDPAYASEWPVPIFVVDNALDAYRQTAIQVRHDLAPLTILITGTEGKTGAKVQLHHLLNQQTRAHGVLNSANTEIPVLRSLINLRIDDRIEINEVSVGGNEALRVERAQMVSPDFCLFTHIGPNHMDMHKTMDNLLWAKSSVVTGMRPDGFCIIDSTNEYAPGLIQAIHRRRPDAQISRYGRAASDDAQLLDCRFDPQQLGWHIQARIDQDHVAYFLPIIQQHAPLASVGVLLAIRHSGQDIHQAAQDFTTLQPYETMGQVVRLHKQGQDILFYDQSRRGGISGMRSAFADLHNLAPGRRVVALVGGISVLHDSDWTREAHQELATLINDSPINRLYTTGNYIDYVHAHLKNTPVGNSNDPQELAAWLADELRPGDLLFIIGSAYLYLGRVATGLRKLLERPHARPVQFIAADSPHADAYHLLKVYADVERGVGPVKSSATHGLTFESFKASRAQHQDYAGYRGYLLQQWFTQLSNLMTTEFGMRCVDDELVADQKKRYVVTGDYCKRWFNNLDKDARIRARQVFGHFFDFGDDARLLYINAATLNLHIGLVGYTRHDDGLDITPLRQDDLLPLATRYPALTGLPLATRRWGPQWISIDLGRHIDLNDPTAFQHLMEPLSHPAIAGLAHALTRSTG